MKTYPLEPRLRRMQDMDMAGKVVLIRVDHNVVKKGRIKDPYRIDATMETLYAVVEKGGRPVLMTHVGRPRDKKTGRITCSEDLSVQPIVQYLSQKLPIDIHLQEFPIDPEAGIRHVDDSIQPALEQLRKGTIGMIYLPNTRWFAGEQAKGEARETLAGELAGIADVFVNDAFGSWQPHASTFDVAARMPSAAGMLLQKELHHLSGVLTPQRPYTAVIAGAKYDTKIGPLTALYDKVDHLILGGLMYNTFAAVKYGMDIAGVSKEDRAQAQELVELDKQHSKILELPYLVESDSLEERTQGAFRTLGPEDLKAGAALNAVVDVAPESFETEAVQNAIASAKTLFVNAVMGLMPLFPEGSQAFYQEVFSNASAAKLLGGGDTLQELKNLCPGEYMAGLDDPKTYYFTGGGSVLSAIEQGSPYGLKPVAALLDQD